MLHVSDVLWGEDDWDFYSYGNGVDNEHEALDLVVTAFVDGYRLEYQLGHAAGLVAFGFDLHRIEVERDFALRSPAAGVTRVLKKVVRAVLSHVGEVIGDRLKCLVFAGVEDMIELALVNTVGVDLLGVQPGRADEAVRRVCMPCLIAKAGKGAERTVCSQPAGDGARVDSEAETAADVVRCAANGVALIKAAEGLQDDFERVGTTLACGARAEGYGA
jgi:hypothetical protein